jgi:excinuclease UvrABC nuclease subunit
MYPNKPGVYILSDDLGVVLYVGASERLCRRVSYLTALRKADSNPKGYMHNKAGLLRKYQKADRKVSIRFLECRNYKEVEKRLIADLKPRPRWNISKPSRRKRNRKKPGR